MYNIIIAESDFTICYDIRRFAEKEGYSLLETENGRTAVDLCGRNKFDALILDTVLSDTDGITTCREIRKTRETPIIFISEKADLGTKLEAFHAGADDFVSKPFYTEELFARLNAIIRRSSGNKNPGSVDRYETGGLIVDIAARRVFVDGTVANMSPKEYDLLFYLVKNSGKAITREDILTNVWGFDFFGDERTLDTHIKLLRKAIGPYADRIITLRGMGYRFDKNK